MFPSVVRIIVHNVHADVIAILRTSILGWLSQLSDYIFLFLYCIFIYHNEYYVTATLILILEWT